MRPLRFLVVMACWCGPFVLPVSISAQDAVIRPEDQRVADVSFRLATAGVARCPLRTSEMGFVLQHLGQYAPVDRPVAAQDYHLDRGPGVLAVVPDGPAARAGLAAGDVLLAVDGMAVPPEPALDQPFDQARNRIRSDTVDDLLDAATARGTVTLTVARGDATATIPVAPVPGCPSRVHLARSRQLNAFADGTHVFLTTRLLALAPRDDELAFVIAHEMAHNILGHAALMRAPALAEGRTAQTRRLERAADLLATDLMLDAGYAVDGAARMLQALDKGPLAGWFGDHEGTGARTAAIAARAAAWRAPAARP